MKLASDKNQHNLAGTSLEKIWDLSPMRLVIGRQKRANKCEVQRKFSIFQIN